MGLGVDFEGTGEHKQLFCGLNAEKKAMVWLFKTMSALAMCTLNPKFRNPTP